MHSSLSNCHYLTKHTDSFTYKRRYNFKNHLPLTIPVCFLRIRPQQFFKLEIEVVNCKSVWFINFCYWPRYLYFSGKSVCEIQIYIAIIVRCMIFLYFFSNHNYHIKRFKLPAKFEHNFETYDSYCIK